MTRRPVTGTATFVLAFVLALVLTTCAGPPPAVVPTPTPTPERGVLAVTALLDLSGPHAAVGNAQRNAMELWMDQEQDAEAPEVRLDVVDTRGSEARLLIELRRAAVERPADAVIVGVPVSYGDVLGRAIDLAALPVLFTLPLDVVEPVGRPGGRWAFALAPSHTQLAAAALSDATARRVLSPALILTEDRETSHPLRIALEAELDRRGREPMTRIALPEGGSVPPVVRTSLSVLRSAHCVAPVPACAAVAREAASIAAPTFFYLSYLATPDELDEEALAARAVWPASRRIVPPGDPPPTPPSAAHVFLRAYGERHGAAGAHAATAFDALTLLAAAAERTGVDDRERSRRAFEGISMSLIATTYSFSSQTHAGFDPADLTFVRWTGSAVEPALEPALGTGIATPTPRPTPSPPPTASPSPSPTPSPSP